VSGPADLTLNELAGEVMQVAGHPGAPRHLPRGAMKVVAATVGRARPQVGRMVRASLIMDTVDLRRSIPEMAPTEVTHIVGSTTAATLLARNQERLRTS
jgi:hypothetical protein